MTADHADGAWHDLIALDRIEKGWVTPASLGNRRLAVHDTPTGIRVTSALCSHAGADLCDGWFDGHVIECPLHQGAFDVRDGRPLGAPATRPLRTYPARIHAGMIQIRL